MPLTWPLVKPVAAEEATRATSETITYPTISRRKATWPCCCQAQRRLRIQLGIAPARNAPIEHQVVLTWATYSSANTTMLVTSAIAEPIAYFVTL